MRNVVVGTGSYLPERIVTNHEIEAAATDFDPARARGASLDEWARRRHGGVSRHRAALAEATSDMATKAAQRAIADAALSIGDIDLIVMATISNDQRLPQAAAQVQANLRTKAKFIQVDAACSGFVDGVMVAHGLMSTEGYKTSLVVCADKLTDFNDPKNCIQLTVFGDGAGAAVLARRPGIDGYGIGAFSVGSDGDLGDFVRIPGGGSRMPFSQEVLDKGLHRWQLEFSRIHDWAVERMVRCTREAVAKTGITLRDVKWMVPHQASVNIVMEVARQLELPQEKVVMTFAHTGNTSAASIPIALDDANRRRIFSDGDWVVMPAVGAGMAWGAFAYRWYDYRAQRGC